MVARIAFIAGHVCYAAICNTDARCNNRREM